MNRMTTLLAFAAVLFLGSAPLIAQQPQWTPSIVPPNPLYSMTPYRYQITIGAPVPTVFGSTFVGWTAPFTPAPQLFSPNHGRPNNGPAWNPSGSSIRGYMYGGSVTGYSNLLGAQRDFERAQQAAGLKRNQQNAANKAIQDQWVYEKAGAIEPAGANADANNTDALQRALMLADEAELLSGQALNQIRLAVVEAEARGAKATSPYLPPRILDDLRFSTPAGDALNLVRQWNKLPFPAVFARADLRELRDTLEKDFAAVALPLLAGKSLEPAKLIKLEQTLKRLEAAATPVIRDLSFEEAIATRKFLNQMANAVKALGTPANTGLVSATWATEGANVSELVKHMTKYKLQFAAAPSGGDSAYYALHRALATYYSVLTQPKK
jgi:hypothetical protein